ncbi:MAG: hypothetical protein M3342_11850 [Bacteroidota bacterium]|nr:hypothetical protein [Bacteroidota bacterium]
MRRIYILILVLITTTAACSQNRLKIHHIIRKSAVESGYLPLIYKDKENKPQSVSLCSENLYGIIRIDQGVPVIDFWPITNNDYAANPGCISKNTELGRFEIDLSRKKVGDAVRYIKVPFSGWIFGIGTTPFRFRPKTEILPSTVSSQIGINLSYGKYFGYTKVSQRSLTNYGLIIGPFAGVTSVRLEKATVKNPDTWIIDRTNAALTYGINIAVTRNNLGIVISWGYDKNFGRDAAYWGYQNKPWLGIGINTYLGIF